MRAHVWWMALATATVLASCSDDGPGVGAIRVTLATTGGDPDLDGYDIVVDSAAPVPVATNDTTLVSNLPTGSHTVVLGGVAPNCDVSEGASHAVIVRGGGTTAAPFAIECFATGVQVTVASSGLDLDPDGYMLSVDGGAPQVVSTNGSVTITRLIPGTHTVVLSGMAANCAAPNGTNPLAVDVTSRQVSSVGFALTCHATYGAVEVRAATSGTDLDPDGYRVTLDDGTPRTLSLNGRIVFDHVTGGTHTVVLTGISDNCPAGGENPRSVPVSTDGLTRDTARTTFTVTCLATTGAIAVTAATSGTEFDPDGYSVRVDNAAPQPLTINGTITFQSLGSGDHTVTLEGAAGNCSIAGDNPRTVSVTTGGATRDTARTTFTVTCLATTGFIKVRAVTSGAELDPDGYTAYVDEQCYEDPYYGTYCEHLWGGRVATNGAVTTPRLTVGEHTVTMSDVAPNCSLAGENPRSVSIPPGDTAEVVFQFTCELTGSVRVTVATTGVDLDPDGYRVGVSGTNYGANVAIPTNGAVTLDHLVAGDYVVTLSGAAANCTVAPPNPRTVTVASGATGSVTFDIDCVQLARLEVTAATSGVDLDPDGYSVSVGGGPTPTSGTVGANGTVTLGPLAPGDYSVGIGGVAMNCEVTAPNPRTITLASGTTTPTAFDVNCAPATQLALVRGRGNDADIYTIKSNGTAEARLTTNTVVDERPAWSPDGSKIAFRSNRDGNAEIYAMDANGANVARLTNNFFQDSDPAWSPDGSKIAFWSDRDGNREIYVMGANGSNPVRLTTQVGDDIDPTWSPDGTKIAFVSYRDGNAELYVMNADGQNPVRLTNNNVEDLQPDWSPDGTKLAFSRAAGCDSYSGFCYYGLWIMNVDGSNATPITGGAADNSPSWSPDGLWIAYGSDVCEDYYYYNYGCYYSYSAVRLLRVDGSRSFDLAYDAFQPAWRR